MKNPIFSILVVAIFVGVLSCKKEDISNRNKLILGTWDCVDYADSVSNELKGEPPVFISNLYEKGYVFKRNNLLWTRNMTGDQKMYTDKSAECQWMLSDDKLSLSLVITDSIEVYDIIEMTRRKMILRGREGFWAGNASTYVFEK